MSQTYRADKLISRIRVCLFALIGVMLIAACSGGDNKPATADVLPTRANFPTVEPLPSATEAPVEIETEDPVAVVVTPQETPELIAPGSSVQVTEVVAEFNFKNEDGTLLLSIYSVGDGEGVEGLPAAPTDERWIVVTASLLNFTGEPIEITQNSIALIDESGNRHLPVVPDEFYRTPLVGTELTGEGTYVGSARFALPNEEMPYLFEWCPNEDCTISLQSPLPETSFG